MLSPTAIDRSKLHPGTGYLIAPRVPHGLAAVVEGLTREVLRHRPEDIYVFAAHHFEKLLKLREQYHTEEYSGRECNYEFTREFNLWPTKETKEIRKSSNSSWSLDKEVDENHKKVSKDAAKSREDVSTDRENRKASKQTCSKVPSSTKRKLKDNETTSEARATRIISQMSALHGPGKSIQTKDIKQELRKNKMSGDKAKTTSEKGVRGERRSKTRVSKSDKSPEEEADRATTTSSSRTSSRRPLKKVRRIETESETEMEREVAAKPKLENNRSSVKSNSASCETDRTGSREKRSEARLPAHSFERKVSLRALSMDRIRAYVLRKFASTASLEVLRSPTYVEQVQEVIDRAAPIIKEKLEEIRGSRKKRSRSVDLAWNEELFRQHVRDGRKSHGDHEEGAERRKRGGSGSESDTKKREMEGSLGGKDEIILNVDREKKKERRRSGSGKRSRKRENSSHGDFEVVDQVDSSSKHSDKSERESVATHDTLEARLTATQNILEDISKSTCELGGARRIDATNGESAEVSDHANISLPVVRPPSSRNSKSAIKNGSDNLTLPPISPEAPKSTKKKDDLSLPILPVADGNHSAKKSQEQDVSKDVDEASTTRDITSDIEDIAILPEDIIVDAKQDSSSDRRDLKSDIKIIDEEKRGGDVEEFLGKDEIFAEKRGSLEEFEELEQLEKEKAEEVFKDSLNVTPEVVDVPVRPDSLEPDDQEKKLQNDDADSAQGNAFDGLKDKLIEIEMAERSIEKALAGQQIATHDGGKVTSQAEKSMTDSTINETRESANEAEETASEIEKSTNEGEILPNKDKEERKKDDAEKRKKSASKIERMENVIEIATDKVESSSNKIETSTDEMEEEGKDKMTESSSKSANLSTAERSTNKTEQMEHKIETSINKIENLTSKAEESASEITKSTNKMSEEEIAKSNETLEAKEIIEGEKSTNRSEKSTNEKLPNRSIEELAVKVHVKDAQSINSKSQRKGDSVTETVCETSDDDTTASKSEAKNAPIELPKTSAAGNIAIESEISMRNLSGESDKTKERRKRETVKLPATSPLSLDIPYSYVLSEGSPCEIPDFVTTVIIPDRPCPSPVTLEDQLESTKELFILSDIKISQEVARKKDCSIYGMEAFGECIHPEVAVLPVDIDFVRSKRGVKASQDVLIAHQDLDRIKEEGEEEEEKEDDEGKEIETKDDEQTVVQNNVEKLTGTLENIAEQENEEETERATTGFKNAEKILSSGVSEQKSPSGTTELIADINSTDEGRVDVAVECCRSTLENSSEESGSTQEIRTTTSSDAKESTASNPSIESPSAGRPIVPELNLDSLQDNTVSSFKMTANDTLTKEDNGSARESDATMSLIEPLTSDEMNQLILTDREEDLVAEELTESLLRKLQAEEQVAQLLEADQLCREEHTEYKLEKDSLSETNLEDKASDVKSEDSTGLPEKRQVTQISEKKEEELGSEEEIAKELISSLDKDMQICVEELKSPKKKSKDDEEDIKGSLDANESNEPEKKEHEILSEGIETLDNAENVKTEMISELSSSVEDKDIAITNKETEESKQEMEIKEHVETAKVAPLAQFEQELLENNSRLEITDKKIDEEKVKSESDENAIDNQEKLEDKQANIEVLGNKSSESVTKVEESDIKHEENDREKLQDQKKELNNQEEREQKKSESQEKREQNKLNIQEKNSQENSKSQEEIVNMQTESLKVAESRKDSLNKSTKNDDKRKETKLHDEFITDNKAEKQASDNEKREKTENLSAKIENIHRPIISTVSEQSSENHSRGYWTMETKSSTVETVIEVNDSNTSTDEKTEAVAGPSEMIKDELHAWKKDDVFAAVLKIQACTRGFLARRHMRKDLNSKPISKNMSSMQKTAADNHLLLQNSSNVREARTGRQRLRREEALRNTTLSLENAFATGRLQHTGEFHDSVPLLLFDMTNNKTNSTLSDDSLNKEVEKDSEQSDAAKSNIKNSGSTHDGEHGGIFQKRNAFTDSFPIVMHLLADASRNFGVNHSRPDFNANTARTKSMEPALDILMLGHPKDDDNRYLNFITSVEDLSCNMDSLPLYDAVKSSNNVDDIHPSMTFGEESLREPLALPCIPQGVVIEEVTSLDEIKIPSESTKPPTAPRTSLDTNSSMPPEECTPEDERNSLDMSPRMVDAIEDRKYTSEEQNSDRNFENAGGSNLRGVNCVKKSNETTSHDNHERTNGKQNEKV